MPYRTKTRPYVKKRQVATNQQHDKNRQRPSAMPHAGKYVFIPTQNRSMHSALSYRLAVNLLRFKPYELPRPKMGKYFDMLMEDVRMQEGLTACMNCGICTGVCPAAEFYCYDPRQIVNYGPDARRRCDRETAPQRTRSGTAASACRAAPAVRAAIRRLT